MAKIDRKRIDTWLSGTQAANGAKAQRASRTANPSSASQADQRPPQEPFEASADYVPPAEFAGLPSESALPAVESEADTPDLPVQYAPNDDPVGLKSLLDRIKAAQQTESPSTPGRSPIRQR